MLKRSGILGISGMSAHLQTLAMVMKTTSFSVTFDYRCPFARNVNEHVVAGLQAGATWEVTFLPFNLDETHVEEGEPSAFEDPVKVTNTLALQAGVVVRDTLPDKFLDVHLGLFRARHDESRDLRDKEVIGSVLESCGVDAAGVFDAMDEGWPLERVRQEHEKVVNDYQVFGVPTFILNDCAVFVRLMNRPKDGVRDPKEAVGFILDLIANNPDINELKHTTISH